MRLVLDDFGTGYSALASLNRYPLVALKIDRLFVDAIKKPGDDAPVMRALVSLGKALGLRVTAEGIETRVQRDYLRSAGVDLAQGFFLGRPKPAEASPSSSQPSWSIVAEDGREPRHRGSSNGRPRTSCMSRIARVRKSASQEAR